MCFKQSSRPQGRSGGLAGQRLLADTDGRVHRKGMELHLAFRGVDLQVAKHPDRQSIGHLHASPAQCATQPNRLRAKRHHRQPGGLVGQAPIQVPSFGAREPVHLAVDPHRASSAHLDASPGQSQGLADRDRRCCGLLRVRKRLHHYSLRTTLT
ncbi:MAG: hypothetical protein DLM54_10630 [Acidimicrobiales bacterium]|nr:MAG: hypothetical protein DLM54_10630 [Acidimicrobiales bacterium]